MNQEFFITLPSNVKGFSYNTISSYNTKLHQKLDFPRDEKWSVGIAEISYTMSWYNVRSHHQIRLFEIFGNTWVESYSAKPGDTEAVVAGKDIEVSIGEFAVSDTCIEPGFYESVQSLCDYVNEKLDGFKIIMKKPPYLIFDKISSRVTLNAGINERNIYFPYLGEEVERILGLIDDINISLFHKAIEARRSHMVGFEITESEKNVRTAFQEKKYNAKRSAELNAGYHSLFVYSDIIEHNFVVIALRNCLE